MFGLRKRLVTAAATMLAVIAMQPVTEKTAGAQLSRSITHSCSGSGDYTGLQNAIDAAGSGGVGGMVTLNSGVCDIGGNTLYIPSSVTIRGLNPGVGIVGNYNGTTIRYSGAGTAVHGAISGQVTRSVVMENLTIQLASSDAQIGIDATGWQFCTLRKVGIMFVSVATGMGVKFASANNRSYNSNAQFNTLDDCVIYIPHGIGIKFFGSGRTDYNFPSGQNQNRIEGGSIEAYLGILMDDDGVTGDYHDGNYIAGVDIENGGCANCIGVEIDRGWQNTLLGNRYEFAASAVAIKYGSHAKGNLAIGGFTYSHYVDNSGSFSGNNPNSCFGPFTSNYQQTVHSINVP